MIALVIVIAIELVIVIYMLWVIAYNQRTNFGRNWVPRSWKDRG